MAGRKKKSKFSKAEKHSPPKHNFRVGDRVKVIIQASHWTGLTGSVTKLENSFIYVQLAKDQLPFFPHELMKIASVNNGFTWGQDKI